LIGLFALLALALLSLRGHAQAPAQPGKPEPLKIDGNLKIKPHQIAKLWPANVPEGAATLWEWDEEKASGETCGANLFLTAPPGSHKVKLLALTLSKDGKLTVQVARAVVVVEGATPPSPAPPKTGARTEDEAKAAIGRISFGNSGCTATVIHPRRPDGRWDILTAAHCTGGVGSKGKFEVGGFSYAVTVTVRETSSDISWLVTDTPQEDLPSAILSKELPPTGTPIWHRSFGVDRPGNKEEGRVLSQRPRANMVGMSLKFSSGDSGGGNFRTDTNEVIATTFGIIGGVPCGGSCVRAWQLRPGGMTLPEELTDETSEGARPLGLMPLQR
jgi:hypothetical protein